MIRGTTALFKYAMPEEMSSYSTIKAVFWQPNNEGTLEAPLPIIMICNGEYNDGFQANANNPKEILVTLTAEQTLRFNDQTKAYTQIIAHRTTPTNTTVASYEQRFTVYPINNNLNNIAT